MVKKLIPAAVLLALGGAAHAQMTIYGLVDAGVTNQLMDQQTTVDFNGNSTTRLGFKGSRDVGSGFKGNFQLEGGIGIDGASSGNKLFGRQAWVGLSNEDLGEVRVGKQDSVAFQTMIGFDLNGGANIASASAAANLGLLQAGRGERSVQYISPEVLPGLRAQAGFQPVARDGNGNTAIPNERTTTSLALSYTLGALSVAATAETKPYEDGKASTAVGASYDFGFAKVALSYSGAKELRAVDASGGFNVTSGRGAMIGLVAPIAGFNVGLQYARNTDTKTSGLEFFVNRQLLKHTIGYADFVLSETEDSSRTYGYAVGVIHSF